MIISGFKLHSFSIDLRAPFDISGEKLLNRQGVIVAITDEHGHEGFGEVSPLPGRSKEELEDALGELRHLEQDLMDEEVPAGVEKLDGKFEMWLGPRKLSPSVRFGLETAILQIAYQRHGKNLGQLLGCPTHPRIRINGLLAGPLELVVEQAKQFVEDGFRGLKLKVGLNIDEDIRKVRAINEAIEGKAILHLDANQAMSPETARRFGEEVGCAATDYIEEPFASVEEIAPFFQETLIPVALDESLVELGFDQVKSIEGVDTLILKPTLLGGVEKTWLFLQEAHRLALTTVISSSFESGVGLWMLQQLAACTPRDDAAGLDTLKWFTTDILTRPLTIERGKMEVRFEPITRAEIDLQHLTPIS